VVKCLLDGCSSQILRIGGLQRLGISNRGKVRTYDVCLCLKHEITMRDVDS
jgi:hypothetical protein